MYMGYRTSNNDLLVLYGCGQLQCAVDLLRNGLNGASVQGVATDAGMLHRPVREIDLPSDAPGNRKKRRAPRLKLGDACIPLVIDVLLQTLLRRTQLSTVQGLTYGSVTGDVQVVVGWIGDLVTGIVGVLGGSTLIADGSIIHYGGRSHSTTTTHYCKHKQHEAEYAPNVNVL